MPSPTPNGPPPTQPRQGQKRLSSGPTPPAKRPRSKNPRLSGSRTPHGSYRHYYARRQLANSSSTDDRVPLITPLLARYESPALLDVGCNDGALTTVLAAYAAKVVGVDIDPVLVAKAKRNLRAHAAPLRAAAEHAATKGHGGQDFIPISCHVVQGPPTEPEQPPARDKAAEQGVPVTETASTEFPFNIFFRREDFASESPGVTALELEAYDVVLCLSVTKWVHLHGGDEALKRLFARLRDCLRPGGVLVLEPQPIKSYKRARQKNIKGANRNFTNDLKLKPDHFKDYLLGKEGGFCSFEMLRDVCEEKGKMFNRPVMAFFKAAAGEEAQDHHVEKTAHAENDGIENTVMAQGFSTQETALADEKSNGKADGTCGANT